MSERSELSQYEAVINNINAKLIPALEGVHYKMSPAEVSFHSNAKFGIALIFICSIIHIGLNFSNYRNLDIQ